MEYSTEGPFDTEHQGESIEQPDTPYLLTLEGVEDKIVFFVAQEIMRVAEVSEADIALVITREDALGAINSIVLCAANNPLVLEAAEKASTPNDSGNAQG